MILVTGAAGYIGSHTLRLLIEQGHPVIGLDNFYSGNRWAVPSAIELVEGNISDRQLVTAVIKKFNITSVIHFAAHTSVEESVRLPLKYYDNNFECSKRLIEVCLSNGVKSFLFSSTAAVYGDTDANPVTELSPLAPVNPYGRSKLMTEWLLKDLTFNQASAMTTVILRYFNVAGAHRSGDLGQATPQATQLIKVACEVASGKRSKLAVFGTDYATPDGTCIRDYIHIEDLANAHALALKYLDSGGASEVFNCGYGNGYSVFQVIDAVEKASGQTLNLDICARRAGDSVSVVADSSKIKKILGWSPLLNDINLICDSAWTWESKLSAIKNGRFNLD